MTAGITKKEQSGETDLRQDNILIIDFGGQYTQLIARVTRELGVFCEIVPYDADFATITSRNPRGVILSGGPESVTAKNSPRIDTRLFSMGIPVLGICYGMQVMAVQLGGEVQTSSQREYGHANVTLSSGFELFDGFSPDSSGLASIDVWMSHGDRVTQMPDGFEVAAKSESSPFAAMMDIERQFIGIQFHPEVTHTPNGRELLSRFIVQMCGCQQSWQTNNIIDELCQNAAQQVGQDEVILGLSGGVDSSVLAALLHRAIGDRLTCVFVDNGLLRAEEATQVMQTFSEHLGVRVIHVDASQQFLSQLVGVTDPEQKRKVIGKTFIDVFQAQAAQRPNAKWLAQGTIYPDVIESAGASTGKAHLIKSHHNVGGLPDTLSLKLLEPLRDLFKDEVRRLGLGLGLPKVTINRHPFPGPGLAVRILGEVRAQYADIIRHADRIFIEELHAANLYDQVSQAFAVFLPIKSVGVVGDGRAYEYVVALRAVETVDFMTAHWARLPYDLLDRVSQRIINEANNISRVTYDISGKPPATIEWE